MRTITRFRGKIAPLDRENVDTDAIIPKQFLKSTSRTGYGDNLFDAWRFLDVGQPGQAACERRLNPDFSLNEPRYHGATILLARRNFGCGSSREHAPWALLQYGFLAVIAPGFGDIFRNNALKNGLVVVDLKESEVDGLFDEVARVDDYALTVDVIRQELVTPAGACFGFALDPFRKRCIVEGLDEISLALAMSDRIRAYEQHAAVVQPWLHEVRP